VSIHISMLGIDVINLWFTLLYIRQQPLKYNNTYIVYNFNDT